MVDLTKGSSENLKTFGPFTSAFPVVFSKDGSKYGFVYIDQTFTNYYLRLNDNVYGPYNNVIGPFISPNGSTVGYIFSSNSQEYVNINGKNFGPYKEVVSVKVMNNNYIFSYKKDDKYYVRFDNRLFGPFDYASDIRVISERYAFWYRKDNRYYANINGTEIEVNGIVKDIVLSEYDSGYAMLYHSYNDSKGLCVLVRDKNFGPFIGEDVHSLSVRGNSFAMKYLDKTRSPKLMFNGKVIDISTFGAIDFIFLDEKTIKVAYVKGKDLLIERWRTD